MIFTELKLKGAFLIDIEPIADERGFFARTRCEAELKRLGLNASLSQCSISFNKQRGTLRGLHFQRNPYREAKLVRCTRGSIFDVIVDLRPDSQTFLQWASIELSAENHRSIYIPEGFAHGFLTLEESCEVYYQMSVSFVATHSSGVRWDDPAFGIRWPFTPSSLSKADAEREAFDGSALS